MNLNLTFAAIIFTIGSSFSQIDVFEASRSGNLEDLKTAYNQDNTIFDSLNEHGFSPLILAVYRNKVESIEFILSKDADVNYQSQEGTALHAACYRGDFEVASLLIEKGANVNLLGGQNISCLIYAIQSKNEQLVKLLVDTDADLCPLDNAGRTPLELAISLELTGLTDLLQPPKSME